MEKLLSQLQHRPTVEFMLHVKPRPQNANISALAKPRMLLRSPVFMQLRFFGGAWPRKQRGGNMRNVSHYPVELHNPPPPSPPPPNHPLPSHSFPSGPVIMLLLWAEIAFCLSGQYSWTAGVGEGCLFPNKCPPPPSSSPRAWYLAAPRPAATPASYLFSDLYAQRSRAALRNGGLRQQDGAVLGADRFSSFRNVLFSSGRPPFVAR